MFSVKWSLKRSVCRLYKILCSSSCRVKCAYVFLYGTEYFDKQCKPNESLCINKLNYFSHLRLNEFNLLWQSKVRTVAHRGHGTYIFISRDTLNLSRYIFDLSRDKLFFIAWYKNVGSVSSMGHRSKEFLQNVCPFGLLFFKYPRFCIRSGRKYVNYKESFSLTCRLSTNTYTPMEGMA